MQQIINSKVTINNINQNQSQEIWKNIEGFQYSISNFGNVRNDITNKILKNQQNNKGYLSININKKGFLIHRLIALYYIPNPNNYPHIDHINGNRTDNRIENLRWVTNQLNHFNERKCEIYKNKAPLSKYKGVSYYSDNSKNAYRKKRYVAKIMFNRKTINIGYFETAEQAAQAYNDKAKELFGEYAKLNTIQQEQQQQNSLIAHDNFSSN